MSRPNVLGKMLNSIRLIREWEIPKAEKELWDRNGLENPAKREGYKIEATTRSSSSGSESTRLQLWKLIDQTEVNIEINVKHAVVTGVTREEKPRVENTRSP